MPIQPRNPIPKQVRCLKCGWKLTWIDRSDTIIQPPQKCPKCGAKEVEFKETDSLWARIQTEWALWKK